MALNLNSDMGDFHVLHFEEEKIKILLIYCSDFVFCLLIYWDCKITPAYLMSTEILSYGSFN